MCGRFALISAEEILKRLFALDEVIPLEPRYNIAPTQEIPAVRYVPEIEKNDLSRVRWGLIPFWAKDPSIGARMINARGENLFEKPAFRSAVRRKRCLIPASGFYEWRKQNGKKQPYFVRLKEEECFAFAGLWDRWESEEGAIIDSCTIITMEANEKIKPFHDRMPLILPQEDYEKWLDPKNEYKRDIQAMIRPYASEAMVVYPVSPLVNKPQNDGPACIKAVELEEE